MKAVPYLTGLAVAAVGISLAFGPIRAAQTGLLDFCPDYGASPRCQSAVELFLGSDPGDTVLIEAVNAIAAKAQHRHPVGDNCDDLRDGLAALGAAVDDKGSRDLIASLTAGLCSGSGRDNAPASTGSIYGGGTIGPGLSSGQTSGGTSGNTSGGTSGETSGGTSGNTSGGTSGNTSGGTSGETSGGTSGETSGGTSGETSGGTSGNTSGGTSGETSGGTSGETSGGTSGNTSGGTSGETSGGTSGNTSGGTSGSSGVGDPCLEPDPPPECAV
ncbi:MAG TPA: hypothetical protein VG900_00450 [Hyphomicrobiaceae bacterium]|nr:hypothetical protein [Hyphomicrobiaceae bacterium]